MSPDSKHSNTQWFGVQIRRGDYKAINFPAWIWREKAARVITLLPKLEFWILYSQLDCITFRGSTTYIFGGIENSNRKCVWNSTRDQPTLELVKRVYLHMITFSKSNDIYKFLYYYWQILPTIKCCNSTYRLYFI